MTEFRIYGDDSHSTYVIVDEEDYHHFVRWRWRISGWGYFKRSIIVGSRTDGTRRATSEYLHVAIMKRVEPEPPTPAHVLVDHRDRNLINCRRYNLRWATYAMNIANRGPEAWPRGPRNPGASFPGLDDLLETF